MNYLIPTQIPIPPTSNDTTMTAATPNAQESMEENQLSLNSTTTIPSYTTMTVPNSME